MKRKNKIKKRKSRKRWLFSILTLLIFFGLFETGLWVANYRYEPFMESPTWWVRFEGQPIYKSDPFLFWRLLPLANTDLDPSNPATHRINSMGFRSNEFEKVKAPGEFRVVTMGDSCTFGDGVANWDTYSIKLEDSLRKVLPGKKVSVINSGVPGYTSYQCKTYLERELLKLKPDVVTIYVGFNDNVPATGSIPDANRAPTNLKLYTTYNILRKSRVVQLLDSFVTRYIRPIKQPVISSDEGHNTFRVPLADYEKNFCAIKELGDKHGFKVIVMTLPHVPFYESERNPWIRKAAKECSIPMMDLWYSMKALQISGENLFEPDGGHPNTLGHQRIAQFLHLKIAALGLAPMPDPPYDLPPDTPFEIPTPLEPPGIPDDQPSTPTPVF